MIRPLALLGLLLGLLVGCTADVDPPWQLSHERIIAVRATPPRIEAGERAELDALLGFVAAPPREAPPEAATVVTPASLAGAVAADAGRWFVTAPGEPELAAARIELGLEPGAPVPLQVGVSYAGQRLLAVKTVWLGDTGANPELDSAMVDGAMPPAGTPLVVGTEVDVPLSVGFDETNTVNWLTSCGEMHDFDLPAAYLRVEPDDPLAGDLAVVVRTRDGGVAWRVWPVRAE